MSSSLQVLLRPIVFIAPCRNSSSLAASSSSCANGGQQHSTRLRIFTTTPAGRRRALGALPLPGAGPAPGCRSRSAHSPAQRPTTTTTTNKGVESPKSMVQSERRSTRAATRRRTVAETERGARDVGTRASRLTRHTALPRRRGRGLAPCARRALSGL